MPLPVPCNTRVTEVRSLPYAELCCLGDPRYYAALRLPPHRPDFRFGLIPGIASAAIDFADGCGRLSPVDRTTFAACRLPYAGEVPGCSRFHGPDCCLRPITRGSTLSVPYGVFFRRGRVHFMLRPAAPLLHASTPTSRRTPVVGFRAPLAACPSGTHTRQSIGPSQGTPVFEPRKRTRRAHDQKEPLAKREGERDRRVRAVRKSRSGQVHLRRTLHTCAYWAAGSAVRAQLESSARAVRPSSKPSQAAQTMDSRKPKVINSSAAPSGSPSPTSRARRLARPSP